MRNSLYPIFARGLAFLVGMLIAALIDINANIHAAPADPIAPDVCELVATAGNITVQYCEPDMGPSFLINSAGFMVVEP